MNDLLKLMGGRVLSEAINSPDGGLPNSFPPGFFTKTRPKMGNIASWKIYPNTRASAAETTYGGPAKHTGAQGFSTRSSIMLHGFEDQTFGQDVFNQLMALGGGFDELGKQELARQTADFRRRFMNKRIAALQSMLALGKVYKNGTQLLPSSSGSTDAIDFGVPANNTGNCNGIISVKWDQTTSTVLTNVEQLQSVAVKNGNPPLRYAFYGVGVANALINDPTTAALIKGGMSQNDQLYNTGRPGNAYGLTWIPVGTQFFDNGAGTQTDMFSKLCVFTPDPNEGNWYEMQEGSYAVPTSGNIAADAQSLADNLQTVYGMFSYARMQTNPVGVQQFAGDTFLPCLTVPSAIFSATVLT